MRKPAVLALAIVAAGCASDAHTVLRWSKPGATSDDFTKVRQACIGEARAQSGGYYIGSIRYPAKGGDVSASVFIPCMGLHGYATDPKGFAAPAGDEIEMVP
jgi:hypothetical protein